MICFRWGCEHEAKVREDYVLLYKARHQEPKVENCGFFIHEKIPYIGASPDGLVSCSCCGLGLMEIKCPFCQHGNSILEAAEDRQFCLETVDGRTFLKKEHVYFYQVQCQLAVTGRAFCDFCVWTGKELFIQRIRLDPDFVNGALERIANFFRKCVLPELLAKYFTRMCQTVNAPQPTADAAQGQVCLCKKIDNEKTVIQCASKDCPITSFHLECMGLKNKRKGWLCTSCRVLAKRKKCNS